MTKKRRRRKPEQIVRAIQEGEAMLAAGQERSRGLSDTGDQFSYVGSLEETIWRHEVR